MPTMANITVKKNDGTTDVTYTAVVAASGDKGPAIWRSNSVGAAVGQRPEFRMTSKANGDQTARRVEIQASFPSLVTSGDTGATTVLSRFNLTASGQVPIGMPDADVNEAVSQFLNLFSTTLVKDSFKAGYAPV